MISILHEIERLRNGRAMKIDRNNYNRYCILLDEPDGTKTGYYFSVPLYNIHTRKAVDMKFSRHENAICAVGSNANIMISNAIRMENSHGVCLISINGPLVYVSEQEVHSGKYILRPTTNGVVCRWAGENNEAVTFDLQVNIPFMKIRANDKYLAFMNDKFRPFVTVSCIGTAGVDEDVIAPAKITYQKQDEYTCSVTVSPCCLTEGQVMFEVNLYEPKLVQDTTVESRNPRINNVFGGTAFIGSTSEFGEQWLYSRLDSSKIPELMDKQIHHAILHLPKYNRSGIELHAFSVAARFCSFGSNWDNKVAASNLLSAAVSNRYYQSLDLTHLLADATVGHMKQAEGIVLAPRMGASGFSVFATGDSHYKPQIWEINYR